MGLMARYWSSITISLFEKTNKYSIVLDSYHVCGFHSITCSFIGCGISILFQHIQIWFIRMLVLRYLTLINACHFSVLILRNVCNNYLFYLFYFLFFTAMLVFDCTFQVVNGDKWISQLKFNTTPIFRQKSAFYTKFIETSLEHGNFHVARTDINNFGNGPEMILNFRIYLDMRKILM